MKRKGLKGKDLREGMTIVTIKSHNKTPDTPPVRSNPLTVVKVCYPFVIVSVKEVVYTHSLAGGLMGLHSEDPKLRPSTRTLFVKGCRFREVDADYVQGYELQFKGEGFGGHSADQITFDDHIEDPNDQTRS